jgi:hypothetical protein
MNPLRRYTLSVLALLAMWAAASAATPDSHDWSGTIRLYTWKRAVYPEGQRPTPPLTEAELAEKARNPNWKPYEVTGKRVDPGGACDGVGLGAEYRRYAAGADITVRNEKGEVVGVAKAVKGAWHKWRNVWAECRMTFQISSVPAAESYSISVAGQRPVKRSYQELQASNWVVELTVP